jgi:hypothetical protein
MQFLSQGLVITSHITCPKIGYRGLMDFELWQIKVFHIPIFRAKNIKNQTM